MTMQTPPELFKNAAIDSSQTDDESFALLDTKAHPLAYEVQDVIADILMLDDVFIKGGAIRNMITGHEVDEIDVIFDATSSGLVDLDNQTSEEIASYVARVLSHSGDFEDCKIKFEGDVNGVAIVNLVGNYKGMPIDFNIVTHEVSTWGCVYDSGSPMLSACMDMNGDCWAHPKFERHLKDNIFEPSLTSSDNEKAMLLRKFERHYKPKYGWNLDIPKNARDYDFEQLGME